MTFISNTAESGGGIFFYYGTGDFQKTIIAGNTATSDNGPDCVIPAGSATSLAYNLIGIGFACAGFQNGVNDDQVGNFGSPIDPLLEPLTDNGGFQLPDGNAVPTHALRSASPAVDVIDTLYCVEIDQRGLARASQDGNGDGGVDGNGCDIGAYERIQQMLFLPLLIAR